MEAALEEVREEKEGNRVDDLSGGVACGLERGKRASGMLLEGR